MLALKMHLFVIMLLLDFLNTPPFAKKNKNKNKNTHIVLSHHVTLVLFSLRVFLFFLWLSQKWPQCRDLNEVYEVEAQREQKLNFRVSVTIQ